MDLLCRFASQEPGGVGIAWVRLQHEDMPLLLRQFAKTLLGPKSAEMPLAEIRSSLIELTGQVQLQECDQMFVGVHPSDMHELLLRYVNALLRKSNKPRGR